MTPRISRVQPLAGVEGGRVTILGQGLTGIDLGLGSPHFDAIPTRPLVASPTRMVAPIPEDAVSGFLSVVWPETVVKGPYFEVARKLAEDLHPVGNPAVDAEGAILTTFSGSRGQAAPGGVSVFRIPPDGGAEPYLSDLMNPSGLAFDASGTLHISCRNDGTIRKTSGPGRVETVVEGLGIATGIAFNRAGTLFVGDRAGTVHAVEPNGATRQFASLPPSVAAYHLAFAPDGTLYVTGPTTSSFDAVYSVDPHGTVDVFYRGLGRPQGLAFDVQGNLYVAASLGGKRGIVSITPEKRAALVISGHGLVGLAFTRSGGVVLVTTNSVFHLTWGIQGLPLI
jgi:sugar lactone lactonase YvrE